MTDDNRIITANGKVVVRPQNLTKEEKARYSLLLVEDEDLITKEYKAILSGEGYERVYSAKTAEEIAATLEKTLPDLILLDLNLGQGQPHGFELMHKIYDELRVPTHFMVVTADGDLDSAVEAIRLGAVDYLVKPVRPLDLSTRVGIALSNITNRCNSVTDGLTGVANKKTFSEHLKAQVSAFARAPQPLSVAMCDIDHFKRYNDTYGHLEGDYLLRRLAQHFSNSLRGTDLFSRCGGEEWGIIMPNTEFNDALVTYQRRAFDLGQILFKPGEGKEERVTLSAGIATLTSEQYQRLWPKRDLRSPEVQAEIAKALVGSADGGLYKIKQSGRQNCYPYNALEKYPEINSKH